MKKAATSFHLTQRCAELLRKLSADLGISQAAVVEVGARLVGQKLGYGRLVRSAGPVRPGKARTAQ